MVHPGSFILFGGYYHAVMGVSCAGDSMLTSGTERASCTVTAGSGELGCSDAPDSAVSFVGGAARDVSFDFNWGTGVAVSGTVSGAKYCEPDVGKMSVLEFSLNMVGGVREGENVVAKGPPEVF